MLRFRLAKLSCAVFLPPEAGFSFFAVGDSFKLTENWSDFVVAIG